MTIELHPIFFTGSGSERKIATPAEAMPAIINWIVPDLQPAQVRSVQYAIAAFVNQALAYSTQRYSTPTLHELLEQVADPEGYAKRKAAEDEALRLFIANRDAKRAAEAAIETDEAGPPVAPAEAA